MDYGFSSGKLYKINVMASKQSRSKSNWKSRVPPTKKVVLTAIQQSWNPFGKEDFLKLVKSMPERIKGFTKVEEKATMY